MDSFLVPFVFVEHARVDVPTLYPHFATRLASGFARSATLLPPSTRGCQFWTIREVVALVALLSGIALSPELQDRDGRYA